MADVEQQSDRPARGTGRRKRAVIDDLIKALPAWQLAVFRFNEGVADRLGIVASDLQCLFVLDRRDSCSPKELAELVNLTSGAASRMIERLLRAGLVERQPDSTDRRRVIVTITAEARVALRRSYDPLDAAVADLLSRLSREALDELLIFVGRAERRTVELTPS